MYKRQALYYGLNVNDGPLIKDAKARFGVTIVAGLVMFGLSFFAATTWMNPLF